MTRLNVSKHRGASTQVSVGSEGVRAQGNPIPYLIPWATALVILVAACGTRQIVQRDTLWLWLWSVAIAAAGVGLTILAHKASRARSQLVNKLATWGVGGAAAAAWVLIFAPTFPWRLFGGYLIATVVVCGGGNLYVAFKGNGDGNGADLHDGVASAVKHIRNLNGARAIDGSVVVEGHMQPGVPATDLQQATGSLASMYGVGANGVKIDVDKNDAGKFKMRVSPVDYLSTPPPFTGPSIRDGRGTFGHGTIMEPIVVGRRLGGQPLFFYLPGDPKANRNASLIQLTGMSGAGKSIFIRLLALEVLSRGGPDEVEYWYLNGRKGNQEPEWLRKGAARVALTRDDVIAALRHLRDVDIPDREQHLGAQGLDQWQPGCGRPFRVVIADEFAQVAPDVERMLTDLSETLRSLGIILVCGFQRATGDRFPTSARSNFGTHACFGVRDEVDAGMALPDEVLDAGARPWTWGNKFPGYCYLSAPGVPEDLWPDEARTFAPNRKLVEQWAEHFIALRAGGGASAGPGAALPVPAGAAAEIVDDVADARPGSAATSTNGTGGAEADDGDPLAGLDGYEVDDTVDVDDDADPLGGFGLDPDDDDPDGEDQEEPEDVIREVLDDLEDQPADVDDLDEERKLRPRVPADILPDLLTTSHRAPISTHGGGMTLRLTPKMSDHEARTYLRSYLLKLRAEGVSAFKVEDIGEDVLSATGMRASWLSKWLGKWCRGPDALLRRRTSRGGHYDLLAPRAIGDGS